MIIEMLHEQTISSIYRKHWTQLENVEWNYFSRLESPAYAGELFNKCETAEAGVPFDGQNISYAIPGEAGIQSIILQEWDLVI
jgi:hypothetical protein